MAETKRTGERERDTESPLERLMRGSAAELREVTTSDPENAIGSVIVERGGDVDGWRNETVTREGQESRSGRERRRFDGAGPVIRVPGGVVHGRVEPRGRLSAGGRRKLRND